MSERDLDQRSRDVLMAIIAEYVQTAEPVGSRSIARRHIRGLSPATIRNVMADLEDLGYLSQPHTSAGRVPTDAIASTDHLDQSRGCGAAAARDSRGPAARSREHIMADRRFLRLTLMTARSWPRRSGATPSPARSVPRDEQRSRGDRDQSGWITARPISAPRLSTEELREIGRGLARRYRGKTFAQILDDVASPTDPLDPLWTRTRSLLDQIAALFRERTLYLSGATHILDHPDLSDPATMRPLLRAFEDKARLIDLLSQMAGERGVQVMIGSENPLEDMRECSIIASTYTYRGQALGVLGVVGPRRMAYSDVMAWWTRRHGWFELAVAGQAHLYLPS